MSDRLWLRKCKLVLGGAGASGLDLSKFRITFKVTKGEIETPNVAEIVIYNLSEDTAARIGREFDRVSLEAGYESACGPLFEGTIRQVRRGRENGTDGWTEITAADGDRAYCFATMNTTLAAGSTPSDRHGALAGSFAEKGAPPGDTADFTGPTLPRGRVYYGQSRHHMRGFARDEGASWSIQDGKLTTVALPGVRPGTALVLTHETGLLDAPEQTDEGVRVRALIHPGLVIGGAIKVDNATVLEKKRDMSGHGAFVPALSADGFYRILRAEYTGDTHGTDWHVDATCLALDAAGALATDTGVYV